MCYEIHIWTSPSPLQIFSKELFFFVPSQKAVAIANGGQTPTAWCDKGISETTEMG